MERKGSGYNAFGVRELRFPEYGAWPIPPYPRPYKLARMVGAEDSSYLTTSSLDAEVLLQERANSYGVPLN